MSDFSDKEFSKVYEEVIENVKNLTTKWSPEITDESDPGLVILKNMALHTDKLNYKIDYRNSQNSVRDVSDLAEGQRLFKELGYQMKKKRSATGEVSVKYLGSAESNSPAVVNLFTQFSNPSGDQIFTSVRAMTVIPKGETRLIKVQEGISLRYEYEGVEFFYPENLTNNLRLPLLGVGPVSDNGVVISTLGDTFGGISDWLNIGDNAFNSVETNNLFSIGQEENNSYIQFYEESLKGLSNGVGIWIISSSGSAGNISKNRISRIVSDLAEGDKTLVSIQNQEFTDGSENEDLDSARKNYYETFGINKTLVGERDYQISIEKEIGVDLRPVVSKALVSGVEGYHNLIEILYRTEKGKRIVLTKFILENLISSVFVSALKYSGDYYGSFEYLKLPETEKLIRRALFKKRAVSSDLILTGKVDPEGNSISDNSTLYNRFIFDIASAIGTVTINSTEEVDSIKEKIAQAVSKAFNASNLTAGEKIPENRLSLEVKNRVPGVVDCSFYYSDHRLVKQVKKLGLEGKLLEKTETLLPAEKRDIAKRSLLRGDLPLFIDKKLQLIPGYNAPVYFPPKAEGGGESTNYISHLSSTFKLNDHNTALTKEVVKEVANNEFVQFYALSQEDVNIYGVGVKYRLLAPQRVLDKDETILQLSTLVKKSIIKRGTKVYSDGINATAINAEQPGTVAVADKIYTFNLDYEIKDSITIGPGSTSFLNSGSVIADGSTINGEKIYGFTVANGDEVDLELNGLSLLLQPTESISSLISFPNNDIKRIRVEGFDLNSQGSDPSPIGDFRLTSSQKIVTRKDSSVTLDSSFYYGVSLNGINKGGLTLNSGESYLLGEGEHFIYSDSNLTDFVDFGSGTLLSIPEGDSLVLDRIINYEEENFESSLDKIPGKISLSNTTISTFSEAGDKITFPIGSRTSNNWTQITSSFKVKPVGGEEIIFDSRYKHREGLIVKTDPYGIFKLELSQSLTLTLDNGNSTTFEGESLLKYIALSSPIYLNGADTYLSPELNLSSVSYSVSTSRSGPDGSDIDFKSTYSSEVGVNFQGKLLVDGSGYFSLTTGTEWYLVEAEVEVKGENGFVNLGGKADDEAEKYSSVTVLNRSGIPERVDLKSGTYQILINGSPLVNLLPGNSLPGNLAVFFENCEKGSLVKILKFRNLADLNPDISFTPTSGEDPSQAYLATFKEGEGIELLKEITETLADVASDTVVPYDFFYNPEAQVKNPTEAIKYYDEQHIMNRNILTVIDLEFLKKNLKIVRR